MKPIELKPKRLHANRKRGSVFIIVLAILSILLLLAATLSYTARLEELSARNFADGIQARMAAQTGVAAFFASVDGRTSDIAALWTRGGFSPTAPGAPTSPYGAGPFARQRPGMPPMVAPSVGTSTPLSPVDPTRPEPPGSGEQETRRTGTDSRVATELVEMRIGDESAKININALGSWAELRRNSGIDATARGGLSSVDPAASASLTPAPRIGLAESLYVILTSPKVDYSGATPEMARDLARSIVLYRYGPDGQPGQAGFDDDGDNVGQGPAASAVGSSPQSPVPGGRAPASERTPGRRGMTPPVRQRESGAAPGFPYGVPGVPNQGGDAPLAPPLRFPSLGNSQDGLDNDYDGLVDEPDEGIDEPDEFIADPRVKPNGDDRPFRTVEDLLNVDGVSVELFQELRPYVTVFSASERRIGPERDAAPQMDLNVAQPVEIYERLRTYLPEVSPETAAQFSANIADYRDADSLPTLINLEGTAEPIFGIEVTPHITEVWPDSTTDDADGDDGQYIEIHNPYTVPISLAGWRLAIRQGARINLRGTLVPGGFLIITDDYNEERDPTPEDDFPHYGSFYDIFGLVPNQTNHLMIEIPDLEIPNQAGIIELTDPSGNLVDAFRYAGGGAGPVRRSYQRGDPRVRAVAIRRCTPYAPGIPAAGGQQGTAYPQTLLPSSEIKNAPFQSALELFNVGCSYVSGPDVGVPAWRKPAIGDGQPNALDERLVDLFTVWTDRPPVRVSDMPRAGGTASTTGPQVGTLPSSGYQGRSVLTECGRININSAPMTVLHTLPGLTMQQAEVLLLRRETAWQRDAAGRPLAYGSCGELVADDVFWTDAPQNARLAQVAEWLESITFTSNAYLIESENLKQPSAGPRLASRSRVQTLVSTDGEKNQVVFWRYLK